MKYTGGNKIAVPTNVLAKVTNWGRVHCVYLCLVQSSTVYKQNYLYIYIGGCSNIYT